ncbi:hypothetical protein DFQ27_008514 [Actinomortierella ambigua]|uniref:Asteroid domain-containing protein n=1 Tax=Actinomortierella ambigua TaxID=1343610 RepID=A0A9P6PQD0_9FUNG|nr:hypothetical protein DFQ27_008514 [Actinomortierella ambigua]
MGVLGLYTFVQSKLGQRKTWTSASRKTAPDPSAVAPSTRYLVLDGNAYIHHIYCGQYEWTYGGQYSAFVNYLIGNIQAIQAVGFTPIFLFDGPLPLQKLQTRLARDTEKISRIGRVLSDIEHKSLGGVSMTCSLSSSSSASSSPNPYVTNGASNIRTAHFLIPPLVLDITLQTLRDLKVELCVCDGEADGLVAQLTREKSLEDGVIEAYALSKDSDYFIYDTGLAPKGGYIPLDTFIVTRDSTTGEISISASVYTQESVANHLGIVAECLPLFASLAGNDYVRPETFERQIAHALEASTGQKLSKSSNIHQTRIRATAAFLRAFGAGKDTHDKDERLHGKQLIHHILHEIFDERRHLYPKETAEESAELRQAILDSMDQYSPSDQPIDISSSSLSGLGGSVQMREAFRTGQFSFKLMDVVSNGMFWCTPFLEDTGRESAWLVSRELRRWVYGILGQSLASLPATTTTDDAEGDDHLDEESGGGGGGGQPSRHDPQRMKEVIEYVRRGDHLSSEIVSVVSRAELGQLLQAGSAPHDMDVDADSSQEALLPSAMSVEDRTTLFLRVLGADTPRVRKLSRHCMVLAATLRYLVTSLAHSKTRSANAPMANYEVIAFVASALLTLEKYPLLSPKSWTDAADDDVTAATATTSTPSAFEGAHMVKGLQGHSDEPPPITKRSLHLSIQFQHVLGSVTLLANVLHLDEILPPLSGLFDGLLFQQILALARGGSSVEQKMTLPSTIEAYVDTLLAVEEGFVDVGDIDVVVVFRSPLQQQQQQQKRIHMYGKQVDKPSVQGSLPSSSSSAATAGGGPSKNSKKGGGVKKSSGSGATKKRAQASQGSRRGIGASSNGQDQNQGSGGGANMFNVLALGCEF